MLRRCLFFSFLPAGPLTLLHLPRSPPPSTPYMPPPAAPPPLRRANCVQTSSLGKEIAECLPRLPLLRDVGFSCYHHGTAAQKKEEVQQPRPQRTVHLRQPRAVSPQLRWRAATARRRRVGSRCTLGTPRPSPLLLPPPEEEEAREELSAAAGGASAAAPGPFCGKSGSRLLLGCAALRPVRVTSSAGAGRRV